MEHWTTLLFFGLKYGFFLSVILCLTIVLTLKLNPQIWFKNYPPLAQQNALPVTVKSRRQTIFVGIPFVVVMLITPIFAAYQYGTMYPASFVDFFVVSFIVSICYNLADTLIVDITIGVYLDPKFARLPGTEAGPSYQTIGFHLKAFIQGVIFSLFLSLIAASVFTFLI